MLGVSPMPLKSSYPLTPVPYDQVSFSDLNIYTYPKTIKVQAD